MEIKTADSRMYSLLMLYDMQSQFFKNVIDGISDDDAVNRLNTKANHVAWLTGSLVQERFEMSGMLGNAQVPSANELFKDHQGIKDHTDYPSLADFRTDWERITPILRNEMINATAEKLDVQEEMMPGESYSVFEMMAFMIYREANCIGQIALWRRLLGYPPMKYS